MHFLGNHRGLSDIHGLPSKKSFFPLGEDYNKKRVEGKKDFFLLAFKKGYFIVEAVKLSSKVLIKLVLTQLFHHI